MIRIKLIFVFIFYLHVFPSFSQEEPNEDATELSFASDEQTEDKFQEYFFEALKQKGIENYELAITALNKAEPLAGSKEDKAAVQFEKAKNYAWLKQYYEAEALYQEILFSLGDRMDVLEHLYDVYHKQGDYEKAIPIVKKLVLHHDDYKEDLVNLYIHTQRYDDALTLLKELDSEWGESDLRNDLKAQIYRHTGNTKMAIEELEQKIEIHPKSEKEYLNLIFLYSEQGEKEKAFETAQELLKKIPDSELAHLALYKYYIERNQVEEALHSMKIVFNTDELDDETMLKVMNDFILFVDKNPQYREDLENISAVYAKRNGKVYELMGNYYLGKNQNHLALEYYQKGVVKDPDNYSLIKNTLLLQLDHENFKEAEALSKKALDLFPAQALLYLINGVANNGLKNFEKAIEILDMGIDFVPDDPKMEYDFLEQLSIAYRNSGDERKAEIYSQRASKIQVPEK